MLHWEKGRVLAELEGWAGVQRLLVQLDAPGAESVRALAYPELTGAIAEGETVLLNTNALRRGLGTGGDALVVARADPPHDAQPAPAGHMVKARYTPMQTIVDAIDDPASPHYPVMRSAQSLERMPVVVADLHSSLPAIIAGIRAERPGARVAYVMTDSAALPAAYSRTVAALREADWIDACISAGQAFGGDLEAVSVHSALLGAHHVVHADVAIAIQGPGNLGTGTGWGFSGAAGIEALHAAHTLSGRPVAALRVSSGDARERHHGLSHHSATVLGAGVLAPVDLPLPAMPHSGFWLSVGEQLNNAVIVPAIERGVRHRIHRVSTSGLLEALHGAPVRLSTMGRGLEEDSESFLAAAAAGRHAAALLEAEGRSRD